MEESVKKMALEYIAEEIIVKCGDFPFPFGVTTGMCAIQSDWARILTENRDILANKLIAGLAKNGNRLDYTAASIAKEASVIVKYAFDLLKKSDDGIFEGGNEEFLNWLKE
jgi:hypothetical protein